MSVGVPANRCSACSAQPAAREKKLRPSSSVVSVGGFEDRLSNTPTLNPPRTAPLTHISWIAKLCRSKRYFLPHFGQAKSALTGVAGVPVISFDSPTIPIDAWHDGRVIAPQSAILNIPF